jgi:hypothetical protein
MGAKIAEESGWRKGISAALETFQFVAAGVSRLKFPRKYHEVRAD